MREETMGINISAADIKLEPQIDKIEKENTPIPEIGNKPRIIQVQRLEEHIKFGSVDNPIEAASGKKYEDHTANEKLQKDVVEEWPTQEKVHKYYFPIYRFYENPKQKAEIDEADQENQKNIQARLRVVNALKEKWTKRSEVIAQDKRYRTIIDENRKEMEPFWHPLGKLNADNVGRGKGMDISSSEDVINDIIYSLHYRLQHESNSLVEEKQLVMEIKRLEGTRGKVISNASMKAKGSLDQEKTIQDQLIDIDLDGAKKERQAIKIKINHLEEELKDIDEEIGFLHMELCRITAKKNRAYMTFNERRKAREELNESYYQNRALLIEVQNLAVKKDLSAIETFVFKETEKFMSQWNSNKAFRDDYEKRILPSLDSRRLSRDGRMRNPDEKPFFTAPVSESEAPSVTTVGINKGNEVSTSRHYTDYTQKAQDLEATKSTIVHYGMKRGDLRDKENLTESNDARKEKFAAKLKELRRDNEIVLF